MRLPQRSLRETLFIASPKAFEYLIVVPFIQARMLLNQPRNLTPISFSRVPMHFSSSYQSPNFLAVFEEHIKNHVEYRELRRICVANTLKGSISPTSLSQSSTPGVYTRFPFSQECQEKGNVARVESGVIRSEMRGINLCVRMSMPSMVSRLREEVICSELKGRKEALNKLMLHLVNKLTVLSQQNGCLRESVLEAAKLMGAMRDDYEARVSTEKQRTIEEEKKRLVAVCSLRNRWGQQKSELQEEVMQLRSEVELLRKELSTKYQEVKELKAQGEESLFDIDVLRRKVAIMEDGDMMRLFSLQLSESLSEVSDLVLLRPHEGACVVDKFRELHSAVKELVLEVGARRKNSEKMAETIFKLEEERLMWIGEGIKHTHLQ